MLHVADLSCARGGVPLLSNLSFDLCAGEIRVLRGPNGVGKTTLLRTLAGLQSPFAGQVEAAEDSLVYAGHANGLKATLTVQENLEFWAQVYGTDSIEPALKAFDLVSLRQRLARTLSAGQTRRLGLARLLVAQRPIWLLDEPTVSLDTDSVALFAQSVRDHCGKGAAALIATHIDLGLEADTIDLGSYRADPNTRVSSNLAFAEALE